MKIEPIGYVYSPRREMVDENWSDVESKIILDEEFKTGLEGLDFFSHAIIITYLHKATFDRNHHLRRHPKDRKDMPKIGIFAQRAKHRPNPIGITAVKIIGISDNFLIVKGLDAIDGTPVLDVKPYYPQYDCINDATTPDWVKIIMDNYF